MPPLFIEMKILKHTFRIPNLKVEDGELIEDGYRDETYTFTLLFKGLGIFEELTGTPLLAYIYQIDDINNKDSIAKLMTKDFIPNLACASYCKIENDKFHNNRATAEEFKKLPVYQEINNDLEFATDLLQMAMDCMIDNKTKNNEELDTKKSKK